VDVTASRCFAVPNGAPIGGIRLNLAGREPHGVLEPGRAADELCAELERDLRAIVDERTGAPLIAAVHRTDALHGGPRRDALPDLLVEWSATPPTGTTALANGRGARIRASSAKIGTVEGTNRYARTGEHVPTGMFIYAGPGAPRGRREQPVAITDFYPTICALLGVAAPAAGSPIPEIVRDERRASA
jgi:predicted AlkP superfamily phosphohydrolase/phosphomutase